MSEDQVWAADCLSATRHLVPVKPHWRGARREAAAVLRACRSGKPMNPDHVPVHASLQKGAPPPKRDYFNIADSASVITQRFAALLDEFDLGPSGPAPEGSKGVGETDRVALYPLTILHPDGERAVGEFLFLHVAAHKECFLPERSDGVFRNRVRWGVRFNDPLRVGVRRGAHLGADLWRDRNLSSVLFFSDRLTKAIHEARLSSIRFYKCRMVADH